MASTERETQQRLTPNMIPPAAYCWTDAPVRGCARMAARYSRRPKICAAWTTSCDPSREIPPVWVPTTPRESRFPGAALRTTTPFLTDHRMDGIRRGSIRTGRLRIADGVLPPISRTGEQRRTLCEAPPAEVGRETKVLRPSTACAGGGRNGTWAEIVRAALAAPSPGGGRPCAKWWSPSNCNG